MKGGKSMRIDIEVLNQVLDNNELLILDKPITVDSNILCCCYIEHLIAKIIKGYKPLLYYHNMERKINCTDNLSTVWDVPKYFKDLSHADMPIPTNTQGYYDYTTDDLVGIMGIYYDNQFTFSETEYMIKELCKKKADLTEEDAFYIAYPKVAEEIYEDEELEECYDSYQAYISIDNALCNEEHMADEETVFKFMNCIPYDIRKLFNEKSPLIASAYISLVFTLLSVSGDSAYNSGLFISLYYSNSIISLEKILRNKKSDNICNQKLRTYNKALQLMAKPKYVMDTQIQDALDELNNLAPKGTCFLLSGYTDDFSSNTRLFPNAGFYIAAITADLLAEEILSELNTKET